MSIALVKAIPKEILKVLSETQIISIQNQALQYSNRSSIFQDIHCETN